MALGRWSLCSIYKAFRLPAPIQHQLQSVVCEGFSMITDCLMLDRTSAESSCQAFHSKSLQAQCFTVGQSLVKR